MSHFLTRHAIPVLYVAAGAIAFGLTYIIILECKC